ncbi:hypothetical protein PBI_SHIFA_14 [Mycobacterium phage Shifa]|uniref:DUF7435 domain-containing protein n=2 Tax=Bixzunavirus hyro TaxID=2006136 RepID=A0A7M1CR53_9CAUD|nr:hypothetical protein HYRO_15 [Mycobacterium phage HyRo]ALA48209.1 hypothetical protein HYRO_15 [Mycobacterium phage HyRo]QOP66890.1 hypothetical protein PBI_SHIFA_14 [Mycobacterium phage Shifa]
MSGEWFETEYGAMHHSDNWQLVAKTNGSYDLVSRQPWRVK